MKKSLKPDSWLFPLPVVLVSCQSKDGKSNIITIAWCGVVASNPPTIGIGVRPSRFSHKIIEETKEIAINIPTKQLLEKVDFCGMVSGKDIDKFQEAGFTPLPANHIKAPLIKECPVNLECKVAQSLNIGSHTLFLGEVLTIWVDEEALGKDGILGVENLELIAFVPGADRYFALGEYLGDYGLSRK